MDFINVCKYLKGGYKEDRHSGVQCQNQRQWPQTETQEVPSKYQETLSYCEGD